MSQLDLSVEPARVHDKLSGRFVSSLSEEERKSHRRRSVAKYNHKRASGQTKALTQREWQLFHKYGLTPAEVEQMIANQGGACAICRRQFALIEYKAGSRNTKTVYHIDHDHETGQVRGILCFQCNSGLGKFKDSKESLLRAIEYLESFKSYEVNS